MHFRGCPDLKWQRRGVDTRSGAFTGGCGCLIVALALVVAVLGFARDVVLGQIAPDRGLSAEHAASIRATLGRWEGSYRCDGRRRALRLDVERQITRKNNIAATFTFWNSTRATGTPLGTFAMKGEHLGRSLILRPDSWIVRASGYRMVPLDTRTLTPTRMTGRVDFGTRGCTTFTLAKRGTTLEGAP